jgi:hypothetical protein
MIKNTVKISKIFYASLWFMVGGFFGTELIKRGVIAPSIDRIENIEIAGWLAVYNLYDDIVMYTILFLFGAILSFILYSFFKHTK